MYRNDFEVSGMVRERRDELYSAGRRVRHSRPVEADRRSRIRRAVGRRMVTVGTALIG